MSDRSTYDVVVVGGGAIGLCCAWRAAQRGAQVVVLDRAQPPAGATRVAAGMLAPIGELAFGEPELLRMTLAAAKLYPDFVAELESASGMSTGYVRQGALHIALDRDEAAELRRVHDLQRSLGLEAEWLPPRRCRELEPGLTPSFNGGVHAPEEAVVDPRQLSAALLSALAGEGIEVCTGAEVTGSLLDGERIEGVRTAAGDELRADAVVLACGAWSGEAAWLPERARPPVRPVKGQILELRTLDGEQPCRAHRRLRARLPCAAPRRAPDRRRHHRGARLRLHSHRRRCSRAAARGLPPAARGRRDGAGRGDGGSTAGNA